MRAFSTTVKMEGKPHPSNFVDSYILGELLPQGARGHGQRIEPSHDGERTVARVGESRSPEAEHERRTSE